MKKIISLLLLAAVVMTLMAGCSKQLMTEGCRVIRDDGEYVTYQTVCDNCGYEFGTPMTTYPYNVFYNVTCTLCGEIIYVKLDRK